jgi:hypothetical protein
MRRVFLVEHHPGKAQYDAAFVLGVKMPPFELCHAVTPGGAFRQLFAQYRRELDAGVLVWPRITAREALR